MVTTKLTKTALGVLGVLTLLTGCPQEGVYDQGMRKVEDRGNGDGLPQVFDDLIYVVKENFEEMFSVMEGPNGFCYTEVPTKLEDIDMGRVVRIVDGDTFVVDLGGGNRQKVRLIGIDTPEIGTQCADAATYALGYSLPVGSNVTLYRDTSNVDQYGRLLRYVCNNDNKFMNLAMVATGMAKPMPVRPDIKKADIINTGWKYASQNNKGCLHSPAPAANGVMGSNCTLVCKNNTKACGDTCIPWEQSCSAPPVSNVCQG